MIIMSNLNCGNGAFCPPPKAVPTAESKPPKLIEKAAEEYDKTSEKFFEKLNNFERLAQEEDVHLEKWVNAAKKLLGIGNSVEEKAQDSNLDKISKPLLSGGKKLHTALNVVSGGAKVLGYFGVPGAALVGDLSYYNEWLETGLNVLGKIQSGEIKDSLFEAYKNVLSYKKKIIGLSTKDKEEALYRIAEIMVFLREAEDRNLHLLELNKTLKILFSESIALSDTYSLVPKLFSKNRFLGQGANLEIISQMCSSLLLTADVIAKGLEPYRKESTIKTALEELERSAQFVKSLPPLSEEINKDIKELFNE